MFGFRMFGSRLFTTAVTPSCDRNAGKQIKEKVLTGYSEGFGFTSSHKAGTEKESWNWTRAGSRTYFGMLLGQFEALLRMLAPPSEQTEQQPPNLLNWSAIQRVVVSIICIFFGKKFLALRRKERACQPLLLTLWEMVVTSVPHDHHDRMMILFTAQKFRKTLLWSEK